MKNHSSIGCCGIDCGLCPRYHSKGASACPGCGAPDFNQKHPSCGLLTCCSIKNVLETCADCQEFPCRRFEGVKEGNDSFVTHKKIFPNISQIKKCGIDPFLVEQKTRIEILSYLLENFDDGRSKSFLCLSCALLPIENLKVLKEETLPLLNQSSLDIKEKNRFLRDRLQQNAVTLGINLKLQKVNNQ